MPTEKQRESSRANGSKSQGPITPEGKAISARNAERHGLLNDCIVIEGEADDRFHEMLASLIAEFDPQSESEVALVETMAVAKWRQTRIWGMEAARLSEEIRTQDSDPDLAPKRPVVRAVLALETLIARNRTLDVLSRYETRFDRIYSRARRELREGRTRQLENFQTNLRLSDLT
jgi:enoyl-CoA hydratase/carnithine racemase